MHHLKTFSIAGVVVLISLACGGGGNSETAEVIIGQGGQVVIDTDAVKAAEDQRSETAEEAETLSVEDVEVEELNTETEVVEEEGIDVATAEEDPLDSLLNAVSQFQGCLEDDGFEFIGAPGQPGPDGEVVDPSSFSADYLQALQRCATTTNIIASFQAFNEAQENLTPEDIAQLKANVALDKAEGDRNMDRSEAAQERLMKKEMQRQNVAIKQAQMNKQNARRTQK